MVDVYGYFIYFGDVEIEHVEVEFARSPLDGEFSRWFLAVEDLVILVLGLLLYNLYALLFGMFRADGLDLIEFHPK